MSGGVSRNMKGAGAKTSRGCGSKVSITAGTPRALACAFSRVEHRLVAAMHAIERADGDHGALERLGHFVEPIEPVEAGHGNIRSRDWRLYRKRAAHHARRGMNAFSRAPLGATRSRIACGSGEPKASSSPAWIEPVTNSRSSPALAAPIASVRTLSPMARMRPRSSGGRPPSRPASAPRRRSGDRACPPCGSCRRALRRDRPARRRNRSAGRHARPRDRDWRRSSAACGSSQSVMRSL